MSDMEKKAVNNGLDAISDDELGAVAGGASEYSDVKDKQYRREAGSEGRSKFVRNASCPMCDCTYSQYARTNKWSANPYGSFYGDIKCYACGYQREDIKLGCYK